MKFIVSGKDGTVYGGIQGMAVWEEADMTVSGKDGTAEASSSMAEWSLLCQVKMAQYMGVSKV